MDERTEELGGKIGELIGRIKELIRIEISGSDDRYRDKYTLYEELYEKQKQAFDELVRIGEPAVPYLIEVLKNKNESWRLRNLMAGRLGEIGDKRAVPEFIEILNDKDENEWVQKGVARALLKIGFEKVPEEKRVEVKVKALLILKRFDEIVGIGKDAAPYLIDVLETGDYSQRMDVAYLLLKIGFEKVPEEKRVEGKVKALLILKRVDEIVEIGEPAVDYLIKALEDRNEGVRERAAVALGEIGDKGAVPELIERFKDENEDMDVRVSAAKALGKIKDEGAVPELIKGLKNEKLEIRKIAAEVLMEIGEPAVPYLIKVLKNKDENWYVRRVAAVALGEIGDKGAVPELMERFKDENEDMDVRVSAAKALGKIKDEGAVPELIKGLKNENWEIQRCSANALLEIGFEKVPEEKRVEVKVKALLILERVDEIVGIGEPAVPYLIKVLNKVELAGEALIKIAERMVEEKGYTKGIDTIKQWKDDVRKNSSLSEEIKRGVIEGLDSIIRKMDGGELLDDKSFQRRGGTETNPGGRFGRLRI
jgi:HEAT repeat protein